MRKRVGASLAFLLGLLFFGLCLAYSEGTDEQNRGVDVISMDTITSYGVLQRPKVHFPHEKHVIDAEKDTCLKCHEARPDGGVSLAFRQRKGLSGMEARDYYHAQCIQCHADAAAATGATGPQVCGGCHVNGEPASSPSSSHAIDFDDTLHSIHTEQATLDCRTCHDRLHGEPCATDSPAMSPRETSHDLCVSCHVSTLDSGEPGGPVTCTACHTDPVDTSSMPRVAAGGGEVLFDHDLHEGADISCETCHHKEPETSCSECHDASGSSRGGGVSLYAAMHSRQADRSCIGCHDAMGAGEVDDCTACHAPFSGGTP